MRVGAEEEQRQWVFGDLGGEAVPDRLCSKAFSAPLPFAEGCRLPTQSVWKSLSSELDSAGHSFPSTLTCEQVRAGRGQQRKRIFLASPLRLAPTHRLLVSL